jgi:hypothetical protein
MIRILGLANKPQHHLRYQDGSNIFLGETRQFGNDMRSAAILNKIKLDWVVICGKPWGQATPAGVAKPQDSYTTREQFEL